MTLIAVMATLLVAPVASAAPRFDCTDPKDPQHPCTDTPEPPKATDTKEPPPKPTATKEPDLTNSPVSPSDTPKPTVSAATATSTPTTVATVAIASLVPPGGGFSIPPGAPGGAGIDFPPVVTILSPGHYSEVTGDSVWIRVEVREDVRLVRLERLINSGSWIPWAYSRAPGSDPAVYTATIEMIPPFNRSQSIIVRAYDSAGQMGEALVIFTRVRDPIGDIAVTNLEITQAVQCLGNPTCPDNSVPLYVNKPTLVRAYVRMASGAPPAIPVYGRICLDTAGSCVPSINGLGGLTTADPVTSRRSDINGTLNFWLPAAWLSRTGAVGQLTVHVNEPGGPYPPIPEANLANNSRSISLRLSDTDNWQIRFAPVVNYGRIGVGNPWAEMGPIMRFLLKVYPVNPLRVNAWIDSPVYGDFPFGNMPGSLGCAPGWDELIMAMALRRFGLFRVDRVSNYAMVSVRNLTASNVAGCGMMGYSSASGEVEGGAPPATAAQELGHNHSRAHAPGCSAAGSDAGYPLPNAQLDEFGVDASGLVVYPPSESTDFMGYCGGRVWVSAYTYRALGRDFGRGLLPSGAHLARQVPLNSPVERMVLQGLVSPQGVTLSSGGFLIELDADPAGSLPNGDYAVELQDEAGSPLGRQSFAPIEMSNAAAGSAAAFLVALPWEPVTARAVFFYRGTEIGRVERSLHAPAVVVAAPSAGEIWAGAELRSIRWSGEDDDGDDLAFLVQYSADGGISWTTIAQGIRTTEMTVNPDLLPGGADVRVRVFASDGLNSTRADSAGGITVETKPPQIAILSPSDGSVVPQGVPLYLQAMAADLEDGALGEAAVAWTSSLDGVLGNGNLLSTEALTVGTHVLTASVSDSQGRTAQATVSVEVSPYVQEIETIDMGSASTPSSPVVVAGMAGLALFLIGVAGIALVRRRARRSPA